MWLPESGGSGKCAAEVPEQQQQQQMDSSCSTRSPAQTSALPRVEKCASQSVYVSERASLLRFIESWKIVCVYECVCIGKAAQGSGWESQSLKEPLPDWRRGGGGRKESTSGTSTGHKCQRAPRKIHLGRLLTLCTGTTHKLSFQQKNRRSFSLAQDTTLNSHNHIPVWQIVTIREASVDQRREPTGLKP